MNSTTPVPCIGFVPRSVPPMTYVIYCEKRGSYAELNLSTLTWSLTSTLRHATRFSEMDIADVAEVCVAHIVEDCGDLWHLTREDFRVVEKP